MTMALPRPSAIGTRPAYLDNLFRDAPMMPMWDSPSLHSSKSSLSTSSSNMDMRVAFHASRPLSPAIEEGIDNSSIRSKRSFMSVRKFRLGGIFNRRTYPQTPAEAMPTSPLPMSPMGPPASPPRQLQSSRSARRPSLPRLQTALPPPPRGASTYSRKPLPAVPKSLSQELSCKRCYYFAARHCNGWVMGGSNGDACEMCLAAGFFGEK